MRTYRGIALITVLLVLLAVVVLGIGTMLLTNSGLMISQNLVSHSVARTSAEAGIDATIASLTAQAAETGRRPEHITAPPVRLDGASISYRLVNEPIWTDDVTVIRVEGEGPRGARHIAEAVIAFVPGTTGGTTTPWTGAVLACEAVQVLGGGRIDSFDSRVGPYRRDSANRNAHVRTLGADGTVELRGYAPIWGDVHSTGGVITRGSSPVLGNIYANGRVDIQASTTYSGSITAGGEVVFGNTATVTGDVLAGGSVLFDNGARVHGDLSSGGEVVFANTGARVLGDALAAGAIRRTHNNSSVRHVEGLSQEFGSPGPVPPVPVDDCDPLNVDGLLDGFSSVTANTHPLATDANRQIRLTPESAAIREGEWISQFSPFPELVPDAGGIYRVPSVNMASNTRLLISGGDVVLFVDGDFTFGGNAKLRIEPGSTLTVYVKGRTRLDNSFDMDGIAPVNADGVPVFALFSSNRSSSEAGVHIRGNAKVSGTVYAPHTAVRLDGSAELSGSALGRTIEVPGGTGLHYDEALADVELGTDNGNGGSAAAISVISRR